MAKLLSNREMELFRVALNYAIKYRYANPDVGFGPSEEAIAKDVAKKLSFAIDEDDIAEICQQIKGS